MENSMTFRAAALLLAVGAMAGESHAGFVDERKGAAAPVQQTQSPARPGAGSPASQTSGVSGAPERSAPVMTPAGQNRAYQLVAGRPVHTQMIEWANSSGWTLKWSPTHTWEVFADTSIIASTADQAVEQVVQSLRMEGKPIRLRVYTGNRVMEIEALTVGE